MCRAPAMTLANAGAATTPPKWILLPGLLMTTATTNWGLLTGAMPTKEATLRLLS